MTTPSPSARQLTDPREGLRYAETMPHIESQGARINYRVIEGRSETGPDAEPLVLLHGFTASSRTNWEFPGIAAALSATNQLILIDFRGHGKSAKPIRSSAYSKAILAADVIAVMDKLAIPRARLFGYSMGAMIAAELLLTYPERFRRRFSAVWESNGRPAAKATAETKRPRDSSHLNSTETGH